MCLAGNHLVAGLHTISKMDFQHIHRNAAEFISSGWLVMLKPAQKLVISLNLPWHRDAIREPCAGILIEAAEKGDCLNTD